ncbi:hypothetical protein RB195_002566 [Necator americanus]|uniref:C2H2-type domain-containing protein n=1 Tax=Necator americanus TaxID=51031 RepID=A0ABR1DMH1_NECAM
MLLIQVFPLNETHSTPTCCTEQSSDVAIDPCGAISLMRIIYISHSYFYEAVCTIMTSSPTVRFVNVTNSGSTKRVRVNIVYERGLETNLATLSGQGGWSDDVPPSLDLEGYEDEVPEWGGAEQEVSSGVADWGDYGEQDGAGACTSRSSELNWEEGKCCVQYSPTRELDKSLAEGKFQDTKSHWDAKEFVPAAGVDGCRSKQQHSNEEPGSQSGRTAFCRLCKIQVKSTLRRTHIYSHHLQQPMYKCPLCDISSTYHLSNIRVHIRKIHNVANEPVCFKEKLENDINSLLYRCFGDRQIFRRQDPEVITCLNDIINSVCNGTSLDIRTSKTTASSFLPLSHVSASQLIADGAVSNTPFIDSAFSVRSQPRNTCRLCFETNVKHLERHVLQYHIKKPMYLCPHCTFSSFYSPTSVKDHIKTRHSLCSPVPIDVRNEYTELIQSVYDQCFLDDPNTFLNRIFLRQPS